VDTIDRELVALRDLVKGQLAHRLIAKKKRASDRLLLQTLKRLMVDDDEGVVAAVSAWKAREWTIGVETEELEKAWKEFNFWS
jgi:hypothetical protein